MLDIKWKNNRKKIVITILVLLVCVLITMAFFPSINCIGQANLEEVKLDSEEAYSKETVDEDFMENLYKGCYVLYQEEVERKSGEQVTGSELFIESYPGKEELAETEGDTKDAADSFINEVIEEWSRIFEEYRSGVDYCVIGEDDKTASNTNTGNPLEEVTEYTSSIEELSGNYVEIFGIRFDENGVMEVKPYFSRVSTRGDEIIKKLGQIDRKNLLETTYTDNFGESYQLRLEKPKDFQVVFAIPANSIYADAMYDGNNDFYNQYGSYLNAYSNAGAKFLYAAVAIFLTAFAFFMSSRKIWKDDVMVHRPGKCYLMEAALIGVFIVLCMQDTLVELIWQQNYRSFAEISNATHTKGTYEVLSSLFGCACFLFCVYAAWYVSVYFLRPFFSLGMKQYVREYSFIYQIFPWLKKKWKKFMDEIHHVDFSEKSTKTIVKIVVLNFIVLSLLSFLWAFGIIALGIYSVVLFYLLKKNYEKIRKDYQTLLQGVNRIAEGDLNTVITEDLGVFEPFRGELVKIRSGFKKAVDEEVKSQRMKTELITNVSHDLKTPLTAITTYVELLKKEDITEEERRSYIETLEKKSLRLKMLIEDLFEVSKASSNNIVLNPIELDVVNLMKQVSIEHVDKIHEKGMELRWIVAEEKVIVKLDNQKTYRIFENLFGNVQKYAMPNSRVYVEVKTTENMVEIVMKNMSAEELNINAEEITERFVRGDSSRNTEGSGLGLAIAKSFTEAQGGKFHIEVDGDLFKAVLEFPLA